MTRRRYTDNERAAALTALAANCGNVERTARELGIPRKTLAQWARGQRYPEAAQMSHEKNYGGKRDWMNLDSRSRR